MLLQGRRSPIDALLFRRFARLGRVSGDPCLHDRIGKVPMALET